MPNNMRIAYLLHFNPGPDSGIWAKIVDQTGYWRSAGHEVSVFVCAHEGSRVLPTDHSRLPVVSAPYRSRLSQAVALRRLRGEIRRWGPDVIYARYDLFIPGMRRAGRIAPLVLEVNTDDMGEASASTWKRRAWNYLTRRILLRAAGGFAFVTPQTADSERFRKYTSSREVALIPNGIDLSRFEEPVEPPGRPIRIVMITSQPFPWTGVDKVVRLAEHFPHWEFDVVGIDGGDLPIAGEVPANVECHGRCTRAEYDPILKRATVALGALSLHSIKMGATSSLKTREYLAYGLPMILAHDDPDVVDVPLTMRLPNTPDNVDAGIPEIRDFVESVAGSRIPRDAVRHIDVSVKELDRLDLMKRVKFAAEDF